jgi:hypothetical protein
MESHGATVICSFLWVERDLRKQTTKTENGKAVSAGCVGIDALKVAGAGAFPKSSVLAKNKSCVTLPP